MKIFFSLFMALQLLLLPLIGLADAPLASRSYTYDLWRDVVPCPDPYTLSLRKTGQDLGVGELNNLNDLFLCPDGTMYIAVSGVEEKDNFILHLDGQLNLLSCLRGYTDQAGAFVPFKRPMGVFFNTDNTLYVADALSKQIIQMDEGGHAIRILQAPTKESSQGLVDEAYGQFVDVVAEGRKLSRETVVRLADGRIYTAKQAQANGLIDAIATREEAITAMKTEYGLTSSVARVFTYEKEFNLNSLLFGLTEKNQEDAKSEYNQLMELAEGQPVFSISYMANERN